MKTSQSAMVLASALFAAVLAWSATPDLAQAAGTKTTVKAADLPTFKRTNAGLYVTSKEAGAAMADDPKSLLLDVRSVAEVTFVGTPPSAYNVPFLMFLGAPQARTTGNKYMMVKNPDFSKAVQQLITRLDKDKSTNVYIMCRSGGRSAAAANVLLELGYPNVYSVVDGFEGSSDPSGRRTVNGWKNSGLQWGYQLAKDRTYKAPKAPTP